MSNLFLIQKHISDFETRTYNQIWTILYYYDVVNSRNEGKSDLLLRFPFVLDCTCETPVHPFCFFL